MPESPAVLTPEQQFNYAELLERVETCAADLKEHGVGKEARVAIYCESDVDILVAFFALWGLRAIAIPINVTLPPANIRQIESEYRPDMALCADTSATYLPPDVPIKQLQQNKERLHLTTPEPSDMAIVMFTSGTSGIPKAVPITHAMLTANTSSTASRLGLTKDDRILINTPAYTTSSIIHVLTLMSVGGSTVIDRQFSLGATLIDQIDDYNCTGFGGVPVHFRRLLAALENIDASAPHLRFLMNSGEHFPESVIKELRQRLPDVDIFCVYGLTEVAGRLCILSPDFIDQKLGSVGFPLDGMEVRVLLDDGKEAAVGEHGEVYVSGNNLMSGYLNNEEANQKSMTDSGFATGDIGYKDEDGFLYLLGRKDDIFKVGGEKVSINVIEQAITGFSAFKDFAVATYENEHMGEVPAIFYVLQENAPDDWKKQIRKQCRASLPKTHMPADMFEVEQIPRTSSGKVIRKKLKQSVNV